MSRLNLDKSWQECDFTTLPTNYTEATLLTLKVRDRFMSLPSKVRTSFDNDPANWIADLEAKQKASREAAKASGEAKKADAAKEAEYRQKRRDALLKPSGDDTKK